jgi:hypothetical protein
MSKEDKYEEPIKIETNFEDVVKAMLNTKPIKKPVKKEEKQTNK